MIEAYCSECRERREMKDAVEDVMKNGRRTLKGKCSVCGTLVLKVVRSESTSARPSPTFTKPTAN